MNDSYILNRDNSFAMPLIIMDNTYVFNFQPYSTIWMIQTPWLFPIPDITNLPNPILNPPTT